MRLPRLFFVLALAAPLCAPLAAAPALAQGRPGTPPGAPPGAAQPGPGPGMHHGRGHGRGGPGMGPGAMSPDERFEHRFERIVGSLGLDDAQAAQVRQIMTEGRAQHEALAAQRLTGEDARARHRQILEQNGQRIRALLRPDQQRIFDFHAARMREAGDRFERGEPGPMMRRGGEHLRQMLESLGLDAQQRTAVQQIVDEGRAQHQALRDQALTGEERRARHRAILEANGQRIRALLRPDQQQRFDAHVARMRQRFEAGPGGPGGGPGGGRGGGPGAGRGRGGRGPGPGAGPGTATPPSGI